MTCSCAYPSVLARRVTFRKHVKFYVMKKSCIQAGITVWYDWQLFAHATRMFYTFGSLKTPEAFLWLKNLTAFFAEYYDVFEAVQEYKKTGKTCDWKETFVPAWESFVGMSYIFSVRVFDTHRELLVEELQAYYANGRSGPGRIVLQSLPKRSRQLHAARHRLGQAREGGVVQGGRTLG